MVDKVKPLKVERITSGGGQDDKRPTETNPNEDYLASKGVAFENSDDHLIYKDGDSIKFKDTDPSNTQIYSLSNLRDAEFNKLESTKTLFDGKNLTVKSSVEILHDAIESLESQFGLKLYREEIILNSEQISSGIILLEKIPDKPNNVRLVPRYGIEQDYGDDYTVDGNQLIFKDLGLDGLLEIDEVVYVYYTTIEYQSNIRFYREEIILNSEQISSGIIILNEIPDNESNVRLVPKYGIEQDYSDDFVVESNQLIFKDLGLDGFLEIGETVYVYYTALSTLP